jgi:DNA-directed RNA polymerase subunit RPC12/RpoP
MKIQILEMRVRYVCPKCHQDVWVLKMPDADFTNKETGCWNCDTKVDINVEIVEQK